MKKSLTLFVYWLTLLTVMLSGADVYSASQYESEPNENKSAVTTVAFGDKIIGNMWHALDYDWYSVNMPASGIVSITAYYEFPDNATEDTDNLFIELRDSSNKVLSDFFIDYKSMDTPYIRDVNIPSSGTYYVVVHCPSTAKFKRDRYYISIANGGGENSKVKFQNEEGSVVLKVDEDNDEEAPPIATLKVSVSDEDGNPVQGALVSFSLIDPDSRELIFSNDDATAGITAPFHLFEGDKQITVKYTDLDYILTFEGPSYFSATLISVADEEDELFLYSVTTDDSVSAQVTKTIISEGDYYLKIRPINSSEGLWEVTIPNTSDTVNQIGTATTGADGIATYTYKSTARKGEFTITASFGNSSDQFKIEQLSGSASKISIVELDNETLYINREYEIKVKVTDSNNNTVEDGTVVNLSSSRDSSTNSTLKLSNFAAETEDGYATFTAAAPYAKEYTLTATVAANTSIKDTLTLDFDTIDMTNMMAQPAYILADGKSTSIISVRLSDSTGLAVGGEPITFSTTCGTLLANTANTATETDTEKGTIAGVAKVALTAPFTPGTCTVTAAYGTKKLTAPVEFYGDGTGSATTSILLETDSKTVPANGTSSVVLTATLSDNSGAPVAAGTPVSFTTDKGLFLNGTTAFKGSMPAGGVVKVALLSKNGETGKANITCASGGVSQSIQITFTAVNVDGSPAGESTAYINLTASPSTIAADGKSSLMVSAELFDSKGQTVPAGTEVVFYAANGKFSNGLLEFAAATTDDSGKVYVALISSTTPGSVDVWCYSNGVFQLTTVIFKSSGTTPDIGNITLTANPTSIPANGFSSTSITAEVKDTTGNPVPSGTSITFTTNAGKFSNGTTTITTKTSDASGKVIIPLISATTAGYAQVTATSGGATQSTLVTFEGGANPSIGTILLSANPTSVTADGSSSTSITAELKDNAGKAVPLGTSIVFTTTAGIAKFSNGSTTITVTTPDATGKVTIPLISAGTAGTADVTATSGGVSQKISVVFKGSGTADIGSILLSATLLTLPADGSSSTSITATVKDTAGNAVSSGTSIVFTTTAGKFSNNSTTITVKTPDDSGKVTIPLIAGSSSGTATVKAAVGSVSQILSITFVGSTDNSTKARYLSLSISKNSVKTDNLDEAEVTATVLDANRVPLDNVKLELVTKSSLAPYPTAGQLSSAFPVTGADGRASVFFSAGVDKINQTVTITASIPGTSLTDDIPIKITGTTLALNPGNYTTLEIGGSGNNSSTLTVTATDAGGNPVYDADITVSLAPAGLVTIAPSTGKTNVDGQLAVLVTAASPGTATITVTGLGDTKTQEYTVVSSGTALQITTPIADSVDLDINANPPLTITVRVPPLTAATHIYFVSTLGMFSVNLAGPFSNQLLDSGNLAINPAAQDITVYFNSDTAGIASISVYGVINGSNQSDNLKVTIAAPPEDAAQISLQASPTIVALGSDNFSDLTATVKNDFDQPVAGASVAFSILNPVGGGETIQTVLATTGSSGIAPSKFISGTVSSGATGIKVLARVINTGFTGPLSTIEFNANTIVRAAGSGSFIGDGFKVDDKIRIFGSGNDDQALFTITAVNATTITVAEPLVPAGAGPRVVIGAMIDDVDITIGGTPGSIVIGRSTKITSDATNTYYILPMSVLVADASGQPVANQSVSLNSWPLKYYTGGWVSGAIVYTSGPIDNEDLNRNNILDSGEDSNSDGFITPPNSSSGNVVPGNVLTGANGVATFDLIYLKQYAAWIEAEIRATTLVSGTETKSELLFTLPYAVGDAEFLPPSPFNSANAASVTMSALPPTLDPDDGTLSTSTITANVNDYGSAVANGTQIVFVVTTGSGTLSSATATTFNGVASVTYTEAVASVTGTETVTAFYTNLLTGVVTSASVNITFL